MARPSENPLRKQTLLGIAPVVLPEPKSEAVETKAEAAPASPAAAEPAFEPAPSAPSIVTPTTVATVATDAPTASDIPSEPEPLEKPKRSEPRHAQPVRPAAVLSSSHDDLPPLKPSRPRWLLPAAAAAAVVLGIIGLRSLDRAPTPLPAELAHPHKPGKAASKAVGTLPKSDEGDDDDDDNGPSTGTDDTPDPTPPDPDPLKAKAAPAGAPSAAATPPAAAGSAAAPAKPASADAVPSSAPATPTPNGGGVRIQVESDPPGARMFWKGKEVGTTPFVLELQPGEKHAYELGLPGYTTRKVVIDGSKTEISIGLRPDPNAPPGANLRK